MRVEGRNVRGGVRAQLIKYLEDGNCFSVEKRKNIIGKGKSKITDLLRYDIDMHVGVTINHCDGVCHSQLRFKSIPEAASYLIDFCGRDLVRRVVFAKEK